MKRNILVLIGIAVVGFVAVGGVISRDVNNSLEEMTGYADAIEDGNLEVQIESSRTDEFGELSDLFARIRDTLEEQLSTVEQRAAAAESAKERAEQAKAEAEDAKAEAQAAKAKDEALSQHLEEKAEEYRQSIEAADGDLTRRLETSSESQAMTDIGEAINDMLADIAAVSEQTADEAQNVSAAAEEQTSAITQISDSAESLSERAEELQSSTTQFETDDEGERGPGAGNRERADDADAVVPVDD